MNIRFLYICFFVLLACKSFEVNGTKSFIEDIDNEVDSINNVINKLKKIEKDIYGKYSEQDAKIVYSCAKSELKVFYNNYGIYKLRVKYIGGKDELISEYYFKDNKLIYVQKRYKFFDPPKWKENSKIKKIVLNEYYIKDNKIVSYNFDPNPIWNNKEGGVDLTRKYEEIKNDVKQYLSFLHDSIPAPASILHDTCGNNSKDK